MFNVGFDPASYNAGLLATVARFVVDRNQLTAQEVQAWASDLHLLSADYFATKPA